jgi:hypothetical protein
VAVRSDFDYASAVRQGSRLKVATKYVGIARDFFAAKGVHVDLIKLYGSMELAPLTGLADAIVDLVSTGGTLKANNLVEVERIMDISARLVVNQAALKLKQEPIRHLIDVFARTVAAAAPMTASARPLRLATTDSGFDAALAARLHWSADTDAGIEQAVAGILADVRTRGDAAVLEYTNRFDMQAGSMADLQLHPRELAAAFAGLPAKQRGAWKARPPGCAATTKPRRRRAARAGATATPTAPCWGRRSLRSTASASTCPAARRPIPRRC